MKLFFLALIASFFFQVSHAASIEKFQWDYVFVPSFGQGLWRLSQDAYYKAYEENLSLVIFEQTGAVVQNRELFSYDAEWAFIEFVSQKYPFEDYVFYEDYYKHAEQILRRYFAACLKSIEQISAQDFVILKLSALILALKYASEDEVLLCDFSPWISAYLLADTQISDWKRTEAHMLKTLDYNLSPNARAFKPKTATKIYSKTNKYARCPRIFNTCQLL